MSSIEKYRNQHGEIWLNVGGGNYFLDGFINVDSNFLHFLAPFYSLLKPLLKTPARNWLEGYLARRTPNNFLFANARCPLPFPPNSVDHILISHFLEHLHFEDAAAALKNYHATLKPGGTLHIIVPDLAAQVRLYLENIGDPTATMAFVDGLCFRKRTMTRLLVRMLHVTGWFDLDHCYMYDPPLLARVATEAGFEILPEDHSPSAAFRREDPRQVNILVKKPVA